LFKISPFDDDPNVRKPMLATAQKIAIEIPKLDVTTANHNETR
jgi:hypothetical protein